MGDQRCGDKVLRGQLERMARRAHEASRGLACVSSGKKNKVLRMMAGRLWKQRNAILKANEKDLKKARKKGLTGAFIERLTLDEKRIKEMTDSLRVIAALKDPVGEVIKSWVRPNGLRIAKVRVPIGVILIIYESRPNVTSDCVGLCLKSGNALILRGGSDAFLTNQSIYRVLAACMRRGGLSPEAVLFVGTTRREAVDVLLNCEESINLVIPRGGESLIRQVQAKSKITVIKHYKGICHVYVDSGASLKMAHRIVLNAKTQRPSVCNAAETLLVHKSIASKLLPVLIPALRKAEVEVRGCLKTRGCVQGVRSASGKDWETEYLDLILSIKVVAGLEEAIAHINRYGSGHSDAIVTQDRRRAEQFLSRVDSACVFVNASTRFTDGTQFGFGAEIGISTDRLHARGPMTLEDLTIYKYVIRGTGQIRT